MTSPLVKNLSSTVCYSLKVSISLPVISLFTRWTTLTLPTTAASHLTRLGLTTKFCLYKKKKMNTCTYQPVLASTVSWASSSSSVLSSIRRGIITRKEDLKKTQEFQILKDMFFLHHTEKKTPMQHGDFFLTGKCTRITCK